LYGPLTPVVMFRDGSHAYLKKNNKPMF